MGWERREEMKMVEIATFGQLVRSGNERKAQHVAENDSTFLQGHGIDHTLKTTPPY